MFKENDIRPLDLQAAQKQSMQKDIDFLVSQKADFEQVNCPACGAVNEETLFSKNGFEYTQCANCTMLYTNPRPSAALLKHFYADSQNHKFFNTYIYPASKEVRREKIFLPRVESIVRVCTEYGVERDNILEIGPGYGLFLEEMVKKNFFKEVVGIEASDTLYETAKKKGFSVYNGTFEEMEIDELFDVIVSFEVIEHIFDPGEFLKKCYKNLKENGVLIMTFPNYNGFDISTLREVSDSISHTHLNYFNEKSISLLLEAAGYTDIGITTPGVMDVDLVRNKILKGLFAPNPFIRDLCIDKPDEVRERFQQFLIEQKMSSNMMVIARKNPISGVER